MSKNRYVLLTGVEFTNQGAYLMMRAALKEIHDRLNAVPVLDFRVGTWTERRAVGARTYVPVRFERFSAVSGIGTTATKASGFVGPKQLTAVLDGSGYRYGDAWRSLNLEDSVARYHALNELGVPIYLLPQALGPFDDTEDIARGIVGACRIIFARDPDSYASISAITTHSEHLSRIHIAPDFTGDVEGVVPSAPLLKEIGDAPIVPNWNIVERAPDRAARDQYIQNLTALTQHLRSRGYEPYGLSHEGKRDTALLRAVADRVTGRPFPVIDGYNGLQLKWIIGQSRVLVSGRYHALASALSQTKRVVAHGWSHKYRWLLNEHGCPQALVSPYSRVEEQIEHLEFALAVDTETLATGATSYSVKTNEMWSTIANDLDEAESDQ